MRAGTSSPTWRKAGQVEVRATLGDGRRIYQRTRGHHLTLKHAKTATITVRGLSADGVAGAPATVKVAPSASEAPRPGSIVADR